MFLFLPIILIIFLIQYVEKKSIILDVPYSNTNLGIVIVFGAAPVIISILTYGSHYIIHRSPKLADSLLKPTSLLPYVCFFLLILPQLIPGCHGSWVFSALEGITGNLKGLQEYLQNTILFRSFASGGLIGSIVNIITTIQYFIIFGIYLWAYYWFNRKGSRDYDTPVLVEFIPSNRLITIGFFFIVFYEILEGVTIWQSNLVAINYIQTDNELIRFLLITSETLIPLLLPFLILLIFPLVLPTMVGWKILPAGPELDLLKKTAEENHFKYNKIYLASNPGLVTAGIIGVFSRTTNVLFTRDIFKLLDSKEIEAVMLHEIGHSKYKHIIFYTFFLLILESICLILLTYYPLPKELELVGYFGLLVLAVRFGWGWLSRQCERQADLNAAEVQGTPEHIINSFYKISELGQSLDKPSWHHGSLRERIDNLENAFQENGEKIRKAYHQKIKMIKIFILIFFVLVNGGLIYRNYVHKPSNELSEIFYKNKLALNYLLEKDYKTSQKYYLEVITFLQKQEADPKILKIKKEMLLIAYYNISCLYALSGEPEKAIEHLYKMLPLYDKDIMMELGNELNVSKVKTDPDLNPLRQREDFLKFIEELKKVEDKFGLKSVESGQ